MATKAPRQREGKPFPGGKRYRKAMAKLQARKAAMPSQSPKGHKYHQPGSLK